MGLKKEWKNIEGYEKFYKVSNFGEIKVKRRVVYNMIDGEMQPVSVSPEKIMSPFDNGTGYLVISLVDENKHRKNFYVHRLVASAFLPNPDNLPQVDHIDYNRKNNKVTNLRWVTVSDNSLHSTCNKPKTHNICDSATGFKYIYKRGKCFWVCLKDKNEKWTDKYFANFEDALAFRDLIIKEKGIEVKDKHDN